MDCSHVCLASEQIELIPQLERIMDEHSWTKNTAQQPSSVITLTVFVRVGLHAWQKCTHSPAIRSLTHRQRCQQHLGIEESGKEFKVSVSALLSVPYCAPVIPRLLIFFHRLVAR